MSLEIGIDVGGTFTDIFLWNAYFGDCCDDVCTECGYCLQA